MIRLIFIFIFFYTYCFADETVLINYPQNSDIIILNPGDYKVDEFDITLKDKEWFAVYENSNFSYIKKVKLKIEKIEPDIQYDWQYRVSVEDNKDCLFLIGGLDLTDRKFDYYTNNDILKNNQDFTFEFGPYHTYISSKIKLEESIGEVTKRYYSVSLNYESNNNITSQELFLFPCYDEQLILNLVWAGDLDNDGKTDFVIQTPILPYNELGDAIGLYLSSRADKEDLVKLVAYFISTGC